jgi:hypothetical protein
MARLVGARRRFVWQDCQLTVLRANEGRLVPSGQPMKHHAGATGVWTRLHIATNIQRVRHSGRFAFTLIAILFACDEGDAHFTTNFASDFTPGRHTVSVLGVYKDGRMSSSGWETLAPHVAPALGASHCDVGYNTLASSNGALADAIDEYARADGPTDDLVTQIAPAAKGDLILVLTFAGRLPQRGPGDAGAQHPAPMQPAAGGGAGGFRRRGRNQPGGRSKSEGTVDTDVLDVSASLYSITQARSIALVAMQYSGASLDEAMTKFAAKLAESLPGTLCVGWNWDVKIDPNRIRSSIDE